MIRQLVVAVLEIEPNKWQLRGWAFKCYAFSSFTQKHSPGESQKTRRYMWQRPDFLLETNGGWDNCGVKVPSCTGMIRTSRLHASLTSPEASSPLNTDVSDVMDARDARTSKIWPLPSRCSHSLVSKTKKQLNELESQPSQKPGLSFDSGGIALCSAWASQVVQ